MHNTLLFRADILFFHKFGNVLQPAMEEGTKLIEGLGLHIIVGLQTANGLAVDTALLPQMVGGDLLLLHGFPKSVKSNHFAHPHLDTVYYGGYNLLY